MFIVFWKYGKQVDPFKQKLPAAKPLKKNLIPIYKKFITPLKNQLDNIEFPEKTIQLIAQKLAKKCHYKNINPTTTDAWKKLDAHFQEMTSFSLKDAF